MHVMQKELTLPQFYFSRPGAHKITKSYILENNYIQFQRPWVKGLKNISGTQLDHRQNKMQKELGFCHL